MSVSGSSLSRLSLPATSCEPLPRQFRNQPHPREWTRPPQVYAEYCDQFQVKTRGVAEQISTLHHQLIQSHVLLGSVQKELQHSSRRPASSPDAGATEPSKGEEEEGSKGEDSLEDGSKGEDSLEDGSKGEDSLEDGSKGGDAEEHQNLQTEALQSCDEEVAAS